MKFELYHNLSTALAKATDLSAGEIRMLLEKPKSKAHGDVAFPTFSLAKIKKASPVQCAQELIVKLEPIAGFEAPHAIGPFLNFRFKREEFVERIFSTKHALTSPRRVLNSSHPIIVEYSSPNIAKPFHVGHLRATLIGNSLDRLYRFLGENVVSINHLGDWGTQFGFVWAGCKLWGTPENASVIDLVDIYRRATQLKAEHEADASIAGSSKDINTLARQYFLDLEKGKDYALNFWQWCRDISLEYLKKTYARLDISFDHYTGESFYSDKLDNVREDLKRAGCLQESQGALGVDLGDALGFARITTPDGRSLYLARDLATAKYRAETFQFTKALYVVGAPQTLHFQQLVGILKRLGVNYANNIEHVAFGHILGMKTRGAGEFIELNDFLDEATERARIAYREQVSKRPDGLDEDLVARHVALSAIIFSTLSRSRLKDVQFKWEHALAFQGDSGPYLLYAYARIRGIQQKAKLGDVDYSTIHHSLLTDDAAFLICERISEFETALQRARDESEPAVLAQYALDLAKDFSRAYSELKVIGEKPDLAKARLALFEITRDVLGQTLRLLGIAPIERM